MKLFDVEYSYELKHFDMFQIQAETLDAALAAAEKKLDVDFDGEDFIIEEVKEVVV